MRPQKTWKYKEHHTEEAKKSIGDSNRIALKKHWTKYKKEHPELLLKYLDRMAIAKKSKGFQKGHPPYSSSHRFEKGHVSWVKGKKGYSNNGSFKKGEEHIHYPISKEAIERLKKRMVEKNPMSNPDIREKCIRNALRQSQVRPSRLESFFLAWITRMGAPYKYVGNGEVIIGWKNPDFINTNGEKICVETANKSQKEYHTKRPWVEYEHSRMAHYAKYGWRCVVLWQDEIQKATDDEIMRRLSDE